MKETWVNIQGYEGFYMVSSLGRVKSLGRVVKRNNKGDITVPEKILKPIYNTSGYYQVFLCMNKIQRCLRVHRLVADNFIENTYNKIQVNHKNGVRDDNRVENLEWSTPSENSKHRYKTNKAVLSQESKDKISASLKGKTLGSTKQRNIPILCFLTGVYFDNSALFAKHKNRSVKWVFDNNNTDYAILRG